MRCEKIRRWISDDMDGALGPGRKQRLEEHFAGCPACRAYRQALESIQAGSREILSVQRPAGDREKALARLTGTILAEEAGGRRRQAPASVPRTRWVWAGAATASLAAAILVFVIAGRGPAPAEEFPLGFESSLAAIAQDLASDPGLADEFEAAIAASIREHEPEIHRDLVPLLDRQALFLESLTDEEVRLLNEELIAEIVS
jgi:predicted anti-sigma-YlaC factor YlaD